MPNSPISGLVTLGPNIAPGDILPIVDVSDTSMAATGTTKRIIRSDLATYDAGTVTASTPTINHTQTWNAGGVSFYGWKLNVTDTASASTSYLMDLQLGGASKLSLTKGGQLTIAADTYVGGALYTGVAGNRTVIFSPADGVLRLSNFAVTDFGRLQFGGTTSSFPSLKKSGIVIQSRLADDSGFAAFQSGLYYLNSGSRLSDTADGNVILQNNAATDFGRLQFGGTTSAFPALKRSTTTLQVKVADDSAYAGIAASDFTAVSGLTYSGTIAPVTLTANRTYTLPDTSGTVILSNLASMSANVTWATDNTYDIGASGATRPRSLYVGTDVNVGSAGAVAFNSDVFIRRDAANTLALRNGVNAQAFNIYNTYTDASNYERGALQFTSNFLRLESTALGTGTAREIVLNAAGMYFQIAGVNIWRISPAGHLIGVTDNTYDIGASGATRPRTIYAGTNIFAGQALVAAASIYPTSASRSQINSPADGVIGLYNNATTDFGRLQFGGTTSAFPSIKRSATSLHFRLADDSGFASIQAQTVVGAGNAIFDTGYVRTETRTVAALTAAATAGAGARSYVTDALLAPSGNFGQPVTGGGSYGAVVWSNGTGWLYG